MGMRLVDIASPSVLTCARWYISVDGCSRRREPTFHADGFAFDALQAAEPAAPPAARQRINPPVCEKPPQAAAAAERTESLSRQPSSAAPRGSDRAAAERKPDDSSARQADRCGTC